MTLAEQDQRNIEIAKEYFRRGDAQDPSLLELFHPELQFYFPKFGIGHGPQAIFDMASGFSGEIESIEHDYSNYVFVARHPFVVVEGAARGRMKGKDFAGGETSAGRFCNMFEFRDGLIVRCHVYLDPDYLGEDEARFRWGRDGREW